jgi:alpha-L-fucosidase
LAITAWKAQRLYTDRKWPNPVVLKITNVSSSIVPPQITTLSSSREGVARAAILTGRLESLGNATTVEVGFQYRAKRVVRNTEENRWQELKFVAKSEPGAYSLTVDGLEAGRDYEFRAVVKHPLVTIFGREMLMVGAAKDPEAGGPIRQD